MKLHLSSRTALNAVTAYGDGYVAVNHTRHEASMILLPDRIQAGWGIGGFEALTVDDFRALADLRPEIALIGTGRRQRFPHPTLLRPLFDSRIGHEIMDVAAACRTYNILMAEGRRVAAALLIE